MGNVNPTLEREAAKRASADPLPGALSEAFLSDAIDVGGVKVRQVKATDWKLLKWLNSPILQQMLELQKPKEQRQEVPLTDEEEWEICFQFTTEPKVLRKLMGGTREAFTEIATEMIADKLDTAQIKAMTNAVSEQFIASFKTALLFFPPEEPAEKKT